MSIGPLSEVAFDLQERADFHFEKLSDFQKGDANYQYHAYLRKELIGAVSRIHNAICCLPQDFIANK